jgi:hypothetical protein
LLKIPFAKRPHCRNSILHLWISGCIVEEQTDLAGICTAEYGKRDCRRIKGIGGNIMESIALHDIDEQLSTLLKQRAAQAQKSIDQFILDTLKKHFGLEKEKEHDDLDELFGSWTDEEFNSIQGKISSERTIDQELW